jgi:hypothetical protein
MKNTGYKINYAANTITVTKTFSKKASVLDTNEYKIMKRLRKLNMEILIKEPVKRKNKKKNPDEPKTAPRPTYDKMVKYINCVDGSEKYLEDFKHIRKVSKSQENPYQYVRAWFNKTFPDFEKLPAFAENGKIKVASENNEPETILPSAAAVKPAA